MEKGFSVLKRKEIYELLQGNGPVSVEYKEKTYGMPYYTASDLDAICRHFNVPSFYGGSRWEYVSHLFQYAVDAGFCDDVLQYFFSEEHFENLREISDYDEIDAVHQAIVREAIKQINAYIRMTRCELVLSKGHFYIVDIGTAPEIETPKLNVRSIPYVQGLRERCKEELLSGNYDSVITKSRTMMEEVLISILEENGEQAIARGDIIKQYNQVKKLFGMQQSKDYDARVNTLLNGLERIVQSIAEMRNANSDAHGVGKSRITVRESEARLVMNSSITFCEYIISKHQRKPTAD